MYKELIKNNYSASDNIFNRKDSKLLDLVLALRECYFLQEVAEDGRIGHPYGG